MKKIKILSICVALTLLSLQTPVLAQNSENRDFIVLNTGDTLYGYVTHIKEKWTRSEFYKKIRLTTVYGKTKKYQRKHISAFRVNTNNYESFWLNQSFQKMTLVNPRYDIDRKDGQQHFLKVVSKAKLTHYELEWFDQENTGLHSMTLLKKENDRFLIRADQGLFGLKRKVLQRYFLDCPKLSEKINQKQLNDVWQIVAFYNSTCIN